MPSYQFLTDRTLVQSTAITPTTLIHVVYTGDTSQNPAGSSYKAELQQLSTIFSGSPFTGNTSGNCISDFYVTNIRSCSPLNINPSDEGNVYFGASSAITIDLTNKKLGIGTTLPQYPLHIVSTTSKFHYDPSSAGGRVNLSADTSLPRFDISIAAFSANPATGGAITMRCWDDISSPGYGKVGDMSVYAGVNTNGLNILNPAGVATEDYVRLYAGQDADGTTPDIHIQGSGVTRGYVGFNTSSPSEVLDVNGNGRFRNIGSSASAGALHYAADGTLTTNTSDENLKENIQQLSGSLETIKLLQGVSFEWKNKKLGGNDVRLGFIAQQIEKIEPKLVFTNKVDGYKGVHSDGIIPLLVEALKEQQLMIEELKEKIKKLETPT